MAYLYTFQFHFEHFMFLVIDIFTQLINEYQYSEKLGYFKKYIQNRSHHTSNWGLLSVQFLDALKRRFSAESRAPCAFLYSDPKKIYFIFSFKVTT